MEGYDIPYVETHIIDLEFILKRAREIKRKEIITILDEIRAEVEDLAYYWCEGNPKTVIDDVLQIIDKYRAESEDKNVT